MKYTAAFTKKYQEIFEYFDAMLLGMTATQRMKSTKTHMESLTLKEEFRHLRMSLKKAVEEGYLVNYSTLEYKSKIMESGIHYDELSDEEKRRV